MKPKARLFVWMGFTGAVLLVLGLKAHQLGWLQPKAPLDLNGQPAVLVLVKYRYVCECEAFVNGNARSQVANWPAEARANLPLHLIDIEQRADLARHFEVIRAPSMLLLDAYGEILWRQDGVTQSTSDGLPLDLDGIEAHIAALAQAAEMENP
jgi:hypothetical protein